MCVGVCVCALVVGRSGMWAFANCLRMASGLAFRLVTDRSDSSGGGECGSVCEES